MATPIPVLKPPPPITVHSGITAVEQQILDRLAKAEAAAVAGVQTVEVAAQSKLKALWGKFSPVFADLVLFLLGTGAGYFLHFGLK